MLEIRKLRSRLLKNLKSKNLSKSEFEREIGFFDKLVSRKDYIVGAGRLGLLGLLIDKGLMPSAWAAETGNFSNPEYYTNSNRYLASAGDDQSATGLMVNADVMKTAVSSFDTNDVPAYEYESVLTSFNPIVQAQSDLNQKASTVGLNAFTRTYGHPEVVQLDPFNSDNVDTNQMTSSNTQNITIHEYNPNGGYGHALKQFPVQSTQNGQTVNLAYQATSSKDNSPHIVSYNKVIAINGNAHNTYDSGSNQILNRKMILAAFVYNEETGGEPLLDNWSADAQKNFLGENVNHAPNQLKLYYQGGGATPAIAGEKITAVNELNEDYKCINVIDVLNSSANFKALVGQYPNLFGDGDISGAAPTSNLRSHVPRSVANQITVKAIYSVGYCGQNANSIDPRETSVPITGVASNIIHGTCSIGGVANIGFIITWPENENTPQIYFYGMNFDLSEKLAQTVNQKSVCYMGSWIVDGFAKGSSALQILRSSAFNYTFEAMTSYIDPTSQSANVIIGAHGASGGSSSSGGEVSLTNETFFTRMLDLKNDFASDYLQILKNYSGDPGMSISSGSNSIFDDCSVSYSDSAVFTGIVNWDKTIDQINAAYGSQSQITMNTIITAFENGNFNFCALQATDGSVDRLLGQLVIALDDALFQFNPVFSITASDPENDHAINVDLLGYDQQAYLVYKGGLTYLDSDGKESDPINFNDSRVQMMHISVNHQGKVNVYVGVNWDKDTNRLYSFAQDPSTGTLNVYDLASINISLLYGGFTVIDQGLRVLVWDNYFHDQEVVYVRNNKKSATKHPAFEDSTNNTEYVYATKDYIAKKWSITPTKIQASMDNIETWCSSSKMVNAHHIELYAVNNDNLMVNLADTEYVEVRFDTPVTLINYSVPTSPQNINATRLNSYFIKPVNGKVYLNAFMDEADIPHGLTMYYRIVDKSQFNDNPSEGGIWNFDPSTTSTNSWYAFNISYQAHARMNSNYSDQKYGDTGASVSDGDDLGNDAISKIDTQDQGSLSNCNSFDDAVSKNMKNQPKYSADNVKSQFTNGYSQASQAGAPTNKPMTSFMFGASADTNNPLVNQIAFNGNSTQVTLDSNGMLGSIWSDIGDAISDAWNAIKHEIAETLKKIESDVENFTDNLAKLGEDFITGNWSDLAGDIGACLKTLSVLIVDVVELVIDVITAVALAIITFLISLLSDPGIDIINNILLPLDLSNQNSFIRKQLGGVVFDSVEQDFSEALKSVGDTIKDGLNEIESAIDGQSKMSAPLSQRLKKKVKNSLSLGATGIDPSSYSDQLNHYYDNSTQQNYTLNELQKNINPNMSSEFMKVSSLAASKLSNDYFSTMTNAFQGDNKDQISPSFASLNALNTFSIGGSFASGIAGLNTDCFGKLSDISSNALPLIESLSITDMLQKDIKSQLPSGLIASLVPSGLSSIKLQDVFAVVVTSVMWVSMASPLMITSLAAAKIKPTDFMSNIKDVKPFEGTQVTDKSSLQYLNLLTTWSGFYSDTWGLAKSAFGDQKFFSALDGIFSTSRKCVAMAILISPDGTLSASSAKVIYAFMVMVVEWLINYFDATDSDSGAKEFIQILKLIGALLSMVLAGLTFNTDSSDVVSYVNSTTTFLGAINDYIGALTALLEQEDDPVIVLAQLAIATVTYAAGDLMNSNKLYELSS